MTFKSALACRWSCELVGEKSHGRLFLWTFTFAAPTGAKQCGAHFRELLDRLRKEWPTLSGVRVFEAHPGGHGWHVHLLTSNFLWVRRVRQLAEWVGFGRIHVKRIPPAAAGYIAKYLSKETECPRGVRLWAVFGSRLAKVGVRVGDVVCEGESVDVFRYFYRQFLKARNTHQNAYVNAKAETDQWWWRSAVGYDPDAVMPF